jgi:hypothetical protein
MSGVVARRCFQGSAAGDMFQARCESNFAWETVHITVCSGNSCFTAALICECILHFTVHPDLGQGHLLLLVVVVLLGGRDGGCARLQQCRALRVAAPPSTKSLHLQTIIGVPNCFGAATNLYAACT